MTKFNHPNQSQLWNAPLCCGCIPIKLIVLIWLAADFIGEVYLLCFKSYENDERSLRFIAAVYVAFAFAVYFVEHKILMTVHCVLSFLGTITLVVFIAFQHFNVAERSQVIKVYNLSGGYIFYGSIILVAFVRIALCWALVNALEKKDRLPRYIVTVPPSYNVAYIPKPSEDV